MWWSRVEGRTWRAGSTVGGGWEARSVARVWLPVGIIIRSWRFVVSRMLCVSALVFLAALVARPSHACNCPLAPVLETYKAATAVFAGRALEVIDEGEGILRTRFEVSRVWKGPLDPDASVYTYVNNGANCGLNFIVGEEYLVYGMPESFWGLFVEEGALHEDGCGATKFLWWAEITDYPILEEAGIGSVVSSSSGSWGAVKAIYGRPE